MNKNRTLKLVSLFLILSLALTSVSSSIAAPPPPEDVAFETTSLPPEAQSASDGSTANARASTLEAPRIRLIVGEFDPLVSPEPGGLPDLLRLSAYPGDGTGYYLLQFRGPIATSDVDALTDAGAETFDYIPDFSFIVKMNNATRAVIEGMEQVRWVGLYQPAYRLPTDLLAYAFDDMPVFDFSQPGDGRQTADPRALWDDNPIEVIVTIFRGEELAPILAQVETLGGTILDQSQTEWKSKLKVSIPPSGLTDLAAFPGVRWIEKAPEWKLFNSEAADIMGVREVWDTHGLYGAGQTIAVCDSGLDQGSVLPSSLHDDFENGSGTSRVVFIHDLVGDGASDVNSGHGTHVAGSVLGNGDLSGATPGTHTYPDTAYVGMAPEASLVFQASEDNTTGSLSGIPLDLNILFAQAAGSGATLHTNSWGSSVMGMYTSSSEDVDEYVWANKDFTILFAASNDGIDNNADGVVDLYSMGSPASAKNCVTVGATENNRPSILSTWGSTDYPVDPINSDYMADDPNGMAAFSSRGPALDGRFKPDIVAPGTFIASVRSSVASGTGWGTIDTNYMYMGGTSMATPLAAGAATLARQYYTDEESIIPSAALIKATLANGATNIAPGQYGTGADQEIPDLRPTNVAGWGRVNLEQSIFPAGTRVMTYAQSATGLTTGASDTYNHVIASGAEPFRVTLAWSDYPGSPVAAGGLVNDLDLKVTGPGGAPYYPNNANQRGVSQHLAHDDGVDNGGYHGSTGGLVAVHFTPASYPVTLQTGLFYVGSNSDTYPKTFNWYVYDGDNTTGPNNTVLASGSTTIRRLGWHVVDLSGEGVSITSGDFFLAIELPDDDLIWLFDNTSPSGHSWLHSGSSWSKDTAEDFMFNAIVKSADASTNQDRVNNLVGVDIETPDAGVYTITVSGYNVPHGPQPYALVASGAITTASTAPAPTVTSITPSSGVNTGTIQITNLAGANFVDGAAVKLTKSNQPDIPGNSVTVVNSNTITCAFDLVGAPTGSWNVVVTNPDDQSGTLSDGFTVNGSPTAPTVTSITPSSGVNTGTVHITNLAGSNFTTTGVTTVTLTRLSQTPIAGDNVTVMSSSQITCDFDLNGTATGQWNVVVMNPDGQSGQLSNGFTVSAPPAPTVTSITPSSGVNTGTVQITNLAGANFGTVGTTTVKLTKSGETAITATNVTVPSSSQITCDFDLNGTATGQWNVVVTNPDGQSGQLTNGFTVNVGTTFIYLPLVLRCYPLVPYLQPISNSDGDGIYTVSWTMPSCGGTPSSYEFQSATNPQFTGAQGDTTSNTYVDVYSPDPATYYWRVRAYVSGQWTDWSNVQSVTVGSFSYVWVDNDTGGTLTIEIVGVETRAFAAGFYDYWRSVPVGTYTVNAMARCGSASDQISFLQGDSLLRYWCAYQALSTLMEPMNELEMRGKFPVVIRAPDAAP